nr:oligopeptide/dipeptide ABC transporter ATP-binding protein [Ktedonospora formicarum]
MFANPRHPYTLGLLASVPKLNEERQDELKTIEGAPPDLLKPPTGCPFMPRCLYARQQCNQMPPLESLPGNSVHHKACWPDISDPKEQEKAARRQEARIATINKLNQESAEKVLRSS